MRHSHTIWVGSKDSVRLGSIRSMRGRNRLRIRAAGAVLIFVALVTSGVGALATGRLGWTNYWGGFVFAPFALIIAALLIVAAFRKPSPDSSRRRRHIFHR